MGLLEHRCELSKEEHLLKTSTTYIATNKKCIGASQFKMTEKWSWCPNTFTAPRSAASSLRGCSLTVVKSKSACRDFGVH